MFYVAKRQDESNKFNVTLIHPYMLP